jgi:hypothetical protein
VSYASVFLELSSWKATAGVSVRYVMKDARTLLSIRAGRVGDLIVLWGLYTTHERGNILLDCVESAEHCARRLHCTYLNVAITLFSFGASDLDISNTRSAPVSPVGHKVLLILCACNIHEA